jgi:sodium-dependent dicarboxylate transporter 2/3/5
MTRTRTVGLFAGLVVFAVLVLIPVPLPDRQTRALAVLALMMAWWFTEAVPIYATAMLPLVLYPALHVLSPKKAALPYVDGFVFLFAGGMVIAAAMQKTNLHRRIALHIMRAIGTDPRRLLLGIMVATAFLSLWISNTATATMMLPIGLAVIAQIEAAEGRRIPLYGCAVMLAIAYAANIGGIGTVIGTAPNAQFSEFMEKHCATRVGFLQFLGLGLPFVVAFLPVAWLAVWRVGRGEGLAATRGREVIDAELAALGPMKRSEKFVLAVFLATAALWIASQPLTAHVGKPLLGKAFASKQFEWGVAAVAGLVLIAARQADGPHLRKVPWETLLLLGGSFSMAAGVEQSGLSAWAGSQVGGIARLPVPAQVGLASFAAVFISAFASNTATIGLLLPLLHGILGPSAKPSLAAATISTSCDFMLPAGTPPNAIVFGSGYVRIPTMMKTGVLLDLAAAALAAAWAWLVARFLFGP